MSVSSRVGSKLHCTLPLYADKSVCVLYTDDPLTTLHCTLHHITIPRYQMVVPMSDLIQTFVSLIELQRKDPTHKVIVFFATARCTQFFAELFCAAGIPVLDIHSRKSQSQRT